jgi:hypothetical protein
MRIQHSGLGLFEVEQRLDGQKKTANKNPQPVPIENASLDVLYSWPRSCPSWGGALSFEASQETGASRLRDLKLLTCPANLLLDADDSQRY